MLTLKDDIVHTSQQNAGIYTIKVTLTSNYIGKLTQDYKFTLIIEAASASDVADVNEKDAQNNSESKNTQQDQN